MNIKFLLSTLAISISISMASIAQTPNLDARKGTKLDNEVSANPDRYREQNKVMARPSIAPSRNGNRANRGRSQRGAYYQDRLSSYNNLSEVFLRIPELYDYYTVVIGDQMVANDRGLYRFYEVDPGMQEMMIYSGNTLVYASRININRNRRVFLDFYENDGIYLLGSEPIQQYYTQYDNDYWHQMWDGYYNNHSYYNHPNNPAIHPGNPNNPNVMFPPNTPMVAVDDEASFSQFLGALANGTFASTQKQMVKAKALNSFFTASQVGRILDIFSFESDRLEIAKMLYTRCVDRNNYFNITNRFSFSSSTEELMRYMESVGH